MSQIFEVGRAIRPPGTVWAGESPAPPKTQDAAEQFEALLLNQILRTARESSGASGDTATEFAEQHLANALAHSGGLGISALISKALSKAPGV